MKRILVVEDNNLNMKLFYDILTYNKFVVEKAFDGIEAYKKIKEDVFDLVILDLQLPKLDGFALLEKLQKEKVRIPQIIIVSACAMDKDKNKALEFNIDTYITKPIDINNFITTVVSKLQ